MFFGVFFYGFKDYFFDLIIGYISGIIIIVVR